MSGNDIDAIADQVVSVLRHAPSGLFTDIDGTISHMTPRPDESFVEDAARDAMRRISNRIAMTGVITGRALDVAEGLVKLPGLVYVGNHGLERRVAGEHRDHPDAVAARDDLRGALDDVAIAAARAGFTDGLILEDKRLSATVHYRQMADPDAFAASMEPIIREIAARHHLRVVNGRLIFELRPESQVTKGTALGELIEERGLRGVVFAGDDTTDVDAFRVITGLRDGGIIDGLVIGVIGPETPEPVRLESDVQVSSVDDISRLFEAVARRLDA